VTAAGAPDEYRVVDRYLRAIDTGDHVASKTLEDVFVSVASGFSERRGISYDAWRDVGVTAAVLARAGVMPSDQSPLHSARLYAV
jgi:hypothetical protein